MSNSYFIDFNTNLDELLTNIKGATKETETLKSSGERSVKALNQLNADAAKGYKSISEAAKESSKNIGLLGKNLDVDKLKKAFDPKMYQEFQNVIKGSEKEVKALESTLKELENVLTDLDPNSAEFKELSQTINQGNETITLFKNELKEINQIKPEIGGNIKAEIDQINAVTKEFESEIRSLERQLSGLENSNQTRDILKAKQIKDEIGQLKGAISENNKVVREYSREVKELEKVENVTTRLRGLKKEINELKLAGQEGTPAFEKLVIEAAKLEDQVGKTNQRIKILASDTQNIDFGVAAVTTFTSALQVGQGAMAALGIENEDYQKITAKLTALMAITNGLQTLQNNLLKDGTIRVIGQKLATSALTKTQAAYTAVVGGTTGALKVFRLALVSTGIGALVVGVGLLIANFDKLKAALGFTKTEQQKFNEAQRETSRIINSEMKESLDKITEQYDTLRAGILSVKNAQISVNELAGDFPELKLIDPKDIDANEKINTVIARRENLLRQEAIITAVIGKLKVKQQEIDKERAAAIVSEKQGLTGLLNAAKLRQNDAEKEAQKLRDQLRLQIVLKNELQSGINADIEKTKELGKVKEKVSVKQKENTKKEIDLLAVFRKELEEFRQFQKESQLSEIDQELLAVDKKYKDLLTKAKEFGEGEKEITSQIESEKAAIIQSFLDKQNKQIDANNDKLREEEIKAANQSLNEFFAIQETKLKQEFLNESISKEQLNERLRSLEAEKLETFRTLYEDYGLDIADIDQKILDNKVANLEKAQKAEEDYLKNVAMASQQFGVSLGQNFEQALTQQENAFNAFANATLKTFVELIQNEIRLLYPQITAKLIAQLGVPAGVIAAPLAIGGIEAAFAAAKSKLPSFYDGTENTSRGNMDNKGGFVSILHPNERVVPEKFNKDLTGIKNKELPEMAKIYKLYKDGQIVYNNQSINDDAIIDAINGNSIKKEIKQISKFLQYKKSRRSGL
jgi:hypothetical protein